MRQGVGAEPPNSQLYNGLNCSNGCLQSRQCAIARQSVGPNAETSVVRRDPQLGQVAGSSSGIVIAVAGAGGAMPACSSPCRPAALIRSLLQRCSRVTST